MGLHLDIALSESTAFPGHPLRNSALLVLSVSLLHLDFLPSIYNYLIECTLIQSLYVLSPPSGMKYLRETGTLP